MTPPTVAAWEAAGTYVRWRERRVFVRTGGDPHAPAVILIHGFPTASWDFHPIWDALAARFHVVTCDLLGLGLSDKPSRGYTIAGQAELIEAVAAWAGVTRAVVLAHDYGDTVAQELLARQREAATLRLTGVAFLNGGLFPEAHHARPIQRVLASPVGPVVARLSRRGQFVRSMRAIAGTTPPTDAELDVLWQLTARGDGVRALPGLLGYLAERRRHRARWVGALVDSPVPCRFVDGTADPVSGADMVARYRALVPRADVIELPGVGHYPQLEAPAQVAAAVLPFLAACATTGR